MWRSSSPETRGRQDLQREEASFWAKSESEDDNGAEVGEAGLGKKEEDLSTVTLPFDQSQSLYFSPDQVKMENSYLASLLDSSVKRETERDEPAAELPNLDCLTSLDLISLPSDLHIPPAEWDSQSLDSAPAYSNFDYKNFKFEYDDILSDYL